eukprot:COSAG05_NODE_3861_length_1801_cov_10.031140_2_plen_66_part_00
MMIFFGAIWSYGNHCVRLLKGFPTMYGSRGRSRGRDTPKSAELPQNGALAGRRHVSRFALLICFV